MPSLREFRDSRKIPDHFFRISMEGCITNVVGFFTLVIGILVKKKNQ